jgi:hypothetical protein
MLCPKFRGTDAVSWKKLIGLARGIESSQRWGVCMVEYMCVFSLAETT